MSTNPRTLLAALLLASAAPLAHAQDAGAMLGRGVSKGEVASLAGLPADRIVATMAAFKSGTLPATVMHQIAKGYTDDQIQAMAAYFAAQKK